MVEQIFLLPKKNEALLLVKNWYIQVASQIAERLNTSRKSQNMIELLPSA